jgi:hypothetical protein
MRKKILILVATTIAMTLLVAGSVMAATPQDIYDDFADNGKLDKTYTQTEINAYLNDAQIQQYGDPNIIRDLDNLLNSRDTFPFTGFQMMLAGIVAVVLISGGVALRFISRPRKS